MNKLIIIYFTYTLYIIHTWSGLSTTFSTTADCQTPGDLLLYLVYGVHSFYNKHQGFHQRSSLGAPPFHKPVPPFKGFDYHESFSLVYIMF